VDDTGVSYGDSFDCRAYIGPDGSIKLEPLLPEHRENIVSVTYIAETVYYEETVWDGEWK